MPFILFLVLSKSLLLRTAFTSAFLSGLQAQWWGEAKGKITGGKKARTGEKFERAVGEFPHQLTC